MPNVMQNVEITLNNTVRQYCADIVQTYDYKYYYAYQSSDSECWLIQSNMIVNNAFTQPVVTHFVHQWDDSDREWSWHMYVYNDVDLYYPNNSESYVVYTNAFPEYPQLRKELKNYNEWYLQGFALVLTCVVSSVIFSKIFRVSFG